ncbi:MAG: rhodanese-like domain-containing protein [Candidatus Binataceae bacterium]
MREAHQNRGFARDFAGVLGLAVLSLVAGLALNHLRASPLPLIYRTPEQRLAADLTKLVEAPPLRLADLDTIGLDGFRAMVNGHRGMILDARAESFYLSGHVPGALNLSRQDFARDYARLRSRLDQAKDRPVVVYCSGGECHDSRLVASALIALGFTQVKIFTGGWTAWTEAGEPAAN